MPFVLQQRPGTGDNVFCNVSERDIRVTKPNIGAGASAIVQKAYLPKMRCFVAIKKINAFERDKRRQLMNDIRALCEVQHPGIVSFLGAYSVAESGQVALVLDYMDGGSLASLLVKAGAVPEPLLAAITRSVLEGLAYLHRRHTIHRDIKPANILIDSTGGAKITDFGISATLDHTLANARTYVGTSAYMSPERIRNQAYSFAADIWSLGLSILECGMGRYPYDTSQGPVNFMIQVTEEEPPLPPAGSYSPAFRDFIALCLRKDPLQRPPAEHLLRHPFVTGCTVSQADVARFIAPFIDMRDKMEDFALQAVFDLNAMRERGGLTAETLRPLYHPTDCSVTYESETVRGLENVVAKVEMVERMHSAFGGCSLDVRRIQAQPVPTSLLGRDLQPPQPSTSGGHVIVHVEGSMLMRGMAGMGGAANSMYAECFLVHVAPNGEARFKRQLFALHKSLPTQGGGGLGANAALGRPITTSKPAMVLRPPH